jgi:phage tail P2-like protein
MLKELKPSSLKGQNIDSLLNSFDGVFQQLFNQIVQCLIYPRIDEISDPALLDMLAWQFHVEGYELAETEQEKRALIKKTIELHRYKGTPWAVKNALSAVGYPATVKEWFQYNGIPYKFKVECDISKDGIIDEDRIELILAIINEYKNVRSWLDDLILYIATRGATPKFACMHTAGESISVYPYQQGLVETRPTARYIGTLAIGIEDITIKPR